MESALTNIPVRSERQAMDWSLVLASQDIAATIVQSPEDGRWSLVVEPDQFGRAIQAIKLYHQENPRWHWKPRLPVQGVAVHGGGVLWCVLLAVIFFLSSETGFNLREVGSMDSELVHKGEWWRLITATTLHADVGHLMANATLGAVFLGLVFARYGAGLGLLGCWFAGIAGNIAGLIIYPAPFRGLGASGMMMGAVGMLTAQTIPEWNRDPRSARWVLSSAAAGFCLFLLLGSSAGTDLVAHLGGFIAGAIFGAIALFVQPKSDHASFSQRFALLMVVGVTGIAWLLALR